MRVTKLGRLLVAGVALTLVAAACGDDGGSTGSTTPSGGKCTAGLSIGFFGALTGDAANLGLNEKRGLDLAVAEFNEKNRDCQIKVEPYDSQGDPKVAPNLAKSAIDNKAVVAIVGPAFSGESKAANPLFNEAGMPLITPSATNPTLSEQGHKVFHRALGNDNSQGPAAALYIKNTVKAKQVAVVDDGSEYGKGLADIVKKDLGAIVKATDQVKAGATDFAGTVTKLKGANLTDTDAIFYGGYYQEAGLLLKQLRDAGVKGVFVAGDGVKDDGFVKAAGAAAEGAVLTCPCSPLSAIKDGAAFSAKFKAKFPDGDPEGTYSAETYDAANFFLAAIAAGNVTRETINTYISTKSWEGLTKTLKFDAKGEVSGVTVYASKVTGGKIVSAGAIK
jgi:branched-chain amino acid transport system substrate-binding protein